MFLASFGHPCLVLGDPGWLLVFPTSFYLTGWLLVFLAGFGYSWPVLRVPGQILVFLAGCGCFRLASGVPGWLWVFSGRFGLFLADYGCSLAGFECFQLVLGVLWILRTRRRT